MSKQRLFTTKGHLLTNARVRTEDRAKDDPPHANGCGCLSCRVTNRIDQSIARHFAKASTFGGKALPPSPGVVFNQKRSASKGPLLPTRGVLAGGAS